MSTPRDQHLQTLRAELAKIRQEQHMKRQRKRRRSKLDPYRDDLLLLKNEGASLKEMGAWLQERGISTGRMTIHNAFARWSAQNDPAHDWSPRADGEAKQG